MFIFKQNVILLLLNYVLLVFAQAVPAANEFTAYLFAFFTGNAAADESIHFALSDDAYTFKSLNNGNPVLSSSKISSTGGVRDPHILRGENNDYYMVATDMVSAKGWDSNHGIVMLKSTNLIDWKSSAVDIRTAFSKYQVADRVWAPQTIYDPVAKKYMVYFAMRLGSNDIDKIYYAYADSTFTKLETEPKLLFTYKPSDKIISSIDGDIIYKDSTYHLFFKTEGSNQKGIKSATSKTLTGSYTLYDKYLQATTDAVEGSCVFKLNNFDTYILMYDVYNVGRYEFATSTDLKTFTKDPKAISFDFKPRHGTIISITATEKKALLAKWNPTEIVTDRVKPTNKVSHRFCANTLEIEFATVNRVFLIAVVDLSGKEILRQTANGKTIRVTMPTLPSGVYNVYCKSETSDAGCTWSMVKY